MPTNAIERLPFQRRHIKVDARFCLCSFRREHYLWISICLERTMLSVTNNRNYAEHKSILDINKRRRTSPYSLRARANNPPAGNKQKTVSRKRTVSGQPWDIVRAPNKTPSSTPPPSSHHRIWVVLDHFFIQALLSSTTNIKNSNIFLNLMFKSH